MKKILLVSTFLVAFFFSRSQEVIKDSAGYKKVDTAGAYAKVEIEAEFPGGLPAWRQFLVKNMNIDYLSKKVYMPKKMKTLKQTAVVQFIVCNDGTVCNIEVVNPEEVDPLFKKEAERLISISPQWTPAVQNGRKVKAYRRQPITLVIEKE